MTRFFHPALTSLALLLAASGAAPPAYAAPATNERTYEPTDAEIANPERGLYVQTTAQPDGQPVSLDTLRALRDDHLTLTLRLYYLKEFRDRPLSDEWLDLIEGDLNTTREAGVKCILRFAYNEAIGEDDAPIDVVLEHLRQIAPLMQEHADVIAVAQAGFVGSWGEWHATTHDLREPENAKRILGAWLEALPPSRFVQVRTPGIKQMLVDGDQPLRPREFWTDTPRARLAHHNDCFLASESDYGTYVDADREKRYLAEETRTLPMGGETCAPSAFSSVENAREELSRFHWSYLNKTYHPGVLGAWQEEGFLDEVRRKLGYRLVLGRAAVTGEAAAGGTLGIELTLRNEGWAAPFNPRAVELVLRSADATHTLPLAVDPRAWQPGDKIRVQEDLALPADLAPGAYEVHLALPDPEASLRGRPEYAIRLANEGLWDPATGTHDLGLTVQVTAAR